MKHWHVQRHGNDDDIYASDGLFAALDYAGDELGKSAESEHEAISACGEQGDFETAYYSFERSEIYGNLATNAANVYKQATLDPAKRAPAYQPDTGATRADLDQHAAWVMGEINGNGPDGFVIWECAIKECEPSDAEPE